MAGACRTCWSVIVEGLGRRRLRRTVGRIEGGCCEPFGNSLGVSRWCWLLSLSRLLLHRRVVGVCFVLFFFCSRRRRVFSGLVCLCFKPCQNTAIRVANLLKDSQHSQDVAAAPPVLPRHHHRLPPWWPLQRFPQEPHHAHVH